MLSARLLLLLTVCGWRWEVEGSPQRPSYVASSPQRAIRPNVKPFVEDRLINSQIGSVLRNAPVNSQLIATQPVIPSIMNRLPDNATLIRSNIVDTFNCNNRGYGYYADMDNECQVFHVCVPLQQLYPDVFTTQVTYQFSFICNKHTRFSQDAMVCAWENEAFPCESSADVYWLNNNFFRKVPDEEKGYGERYAHVNEPQ